MIGGRRQLTETPVAIRKTKKTQFCFHIGQWLNRPHTKSANTKSPVRSFWPCQITLSNGNGYSPRHLIIILRLARELLLQNGDTIWTFCPGKSTRRDKWSIELFIFMAQLTNKKPRVTSCLATLKAKSQSQKGNITTKVILLSK